MTGWIGERCNDGRKLQNYKNTRMHVQREKKEKEGWKEKEVEMLIRVNQKRTEKRKKEGVNAWGRMGKRDVGM